MTKLDDFIARKTAMVQNGEDEPVKAQHEKNKLTARERLDLLFDKNSFTEIDAFVKHRCTNFEMDQTDFPGDGVIGGFGKINGRTVFAYAQDFTIMGGSLGEMQANKICKIQDSALKVGAPIIGLNDSGGARIQEGIDALAGYGKIFFRNTAASGVIPQINAIMGPCAGGAVYSPALADFVFMVDQTSKMFITGPDVIKAVTHEDVSPETLGGANTHNAISGAAHFIARSDAECIAQIRRLLTFLPSSSRETPPPMDLGDDPDRCVPELGDVLPEGANRSYNMYDIITRIVDQGEFFEYMPLYAKNMITCLAHINKQSVGIIANQPKVLAGCIDINASDKAARFIRTCDAFKLPLINLVDVPGFLPGINQEHNGIIRHGAKMLYAYCEATVPKITLIVRKAYGGAYLAMCCKELGADLVYAWPNAEIAVMGPEGAASIIFRLKGNDSPEELLERQTQIEKYRCEFSTPYKAAERGMVDDVIYPEKTRQYIARALDMLSTKIGCAEKKKHGNIPL